MSATSEIAQQLAILYLSPRNTLLLHGRDQKKLKSVSEKLKKISPETKIVILPVLDLINPNLKLGEDLPEDCESIYDKFYIQWFDDVVMNNGLPSHVIIAGGGSAKTMSGTLELNAVSAMKCCENFVRKIRENIHHDKYKNRHFHLVYMNSFLGERPDLWQNAVIYSQAKRVMKKYLQGLRSTIGDVNLHVQNAILGPIDTELLRESFMKYDIKKMSFFNNFQYVLAQLFMPLITSSPEKAAADMKVSIERCEEEFYVPHVFMYIPGLLDFWPMVFNFAINGIIFSAIFGIIFVPSIKEMALEWFNYAQKMIFG